MRVKRYRKPQAKPNELLVKYGQEYGERDLFYCWNGEGSSNRDMKRDSRLLMMAFERVDLF
ncbi:hypothetical protein M316_0049 [Nitrincola phage 1M3-16]|uniref:hypothetical protein n=1 Tax=Nitrincola phage 1M3-16 TaxID=1472912 RepID=UPI000444DFAE|nr:hypothetical protein GJ22_gp103 [Nitrincola phage 1M3-16]AHX01114.1 hypothetical protein M316_0049 [Nitrincola phage 1M3-16]